jgi:solute carrier family 12 (sodium/potassium/chloride transporter), member 2
MTHHPHFKLGWIQGVLIPVLLNIYGVMLFLRMGWIVAEAGIIESICIILLSAIICVITTLSLSAITTNGEVKSGGIYYIISRSLGPEFGASVGVVFAFANAISASMNTIGFCDALKDFLKKYGLQIYDGGVNDTRIIGTIAILIMIVICAVGMEWEVKAQNVLILVIGSAIIDFVVGVFMGPQSTEEIAKGFVGFKPENLEKNLYPAYRFSEGIDQTIFTVFAIFFPSVTGIQAGANICGDLKDPAASIPKGTLLALFISMSTYLSFVFLVGGSALRDASGIAAEVANQTFPYQFACEANKTCQYGLFNSYSMMQLMSPWENLIYIGCFAATLSTALTNLLSVPRLVQALGWDRIFPGVHFFSKGYGKNGEPYRGYVLTLIISVAFVLLADLNLVAPLITNFYLVAYALINFCTFHAAFVQPLGWRPSFTVSRNVILKSFLDLNMIFLFSFIANG